MVFSQLSYYLAVMHKSLKHYTTTSLRIWVFSLGLTLGFSHPVMGCECEQKMELEVSDWNDVDMIFTAKLLHVKVGLVGSAKFKIIHSYRGNPDSIVTIYYNPRNSHLLYLPQADFKVGGKWIIFGDQISPMNTSLLRFKRTDQKSLCALSRPVNIEAGDDPYISFLDEMLKTEDGPFEQYNAENELVAIGSYSKLLPTSSWTYIDNDLDLRYTGNYIEGQRQGEWIKVRAKENSAEIVVRRIHYDHGDPVEILDYNLTGKISLKKILNDTSEIRIYYGYDGKIKAETTTDPERGSKHIKKYDYNGLLSEEQWIVNKKKTKHYWYNELGEVIREWTIPEEG